MLSLAASAAVLLNSACVSSNKRVLVSVIDEATGAPVPGAKVRTIYSSLSKFSLAAKNVSEATTNTAGQAVLIGNFLRREPAIGRLFPEQGFQPGYEVVIDDDQYQVHMGRFGTDYLPSRPFDRPKDYVPSDPDVTFRIPSKASEAVALAKAKEQAARDEAQAREWFANAPGYWPETGDGPNSWPKTMAASILIDLRLKAAVTEILGSNDDIIEIERVVLANLQHPKSRMDGIRWLSPMLAMVGCGWYSGPLAAAGYTCVVEKKDGRWMVVVCYMNWIS